MNIKFDKNSFKNKTEAKTDTKFFKLPYISKYSNIAQKRFKILLKRFVQIYKTPYIWSLTPFKINNKFWYKDPLQFHLQSFIVDQFICAKCKVCYVAETTRHLSRESMNTYTKTLSPTSLNMCLQESHICNSVCNKDCFSVIDQATTEYQLKMKEAICIKWIPPKLNK